MIGIDLVYLPRFEKIGKEKGIDFLQKMAGEQFEDVKRLAASFACKEALGKYLKTGISSNLIKKSKLKHDKNGSPYLEFCGKIYNVSISYANEYVISVVNGLNTDSITRDYDFVSKHDMGKALIISGSDKMFGCSILSSKACMRTGIGYTYLSINTDDINIKTQVSTAVPEIILTDIRDNIKYLKEYGAIGIGPGIGNENLDIYSEILNKYSGIIILDADGLVLLDQIKNSNAKVIITPHEREASKILGCDFDYIKNNRLQVAKELSNRYNCISVLKGHETVCVYKEKLYINNSGNVGMATAGSGDVLTGILTGICARFNHLDVFDNVCRAVNIHGKSGDYMAEKFNHTSLIASDLIEGLRYLGDLI